MSTFTCLLKLIKNDGRNSHRRQAPLSAFVIGIVENILAEDADYKPRG
jgi:hypothetical protein